MMFQVFLRPCCMLFCHNHMRCPRFFAQKNPRFSAQMGQIWLLCCLPQDPTSDAVQRAGSVLRYVAEKRCPELGLQGSGTSWIKMNQEISRHIEMWWGVILHSELNMYGRPFFNFILLGLLEARMLWMIFVCSGWVKLFRVFKSP